MSKNFILAIFFFGLALQSSFAAIDPKSWMNSDIIKQKTLTQITLPGTHDSGSYSVTDDVFDDASHLIDRELIKFADSIGISIGQLFILWSKSQDKTYYEQLNGGIRYLDTRIAWGIVQQKWRTHHDIVLGGDLQTLLDDVKRFLLEQPSEVVVLEMSHIFGSPNSTQFSILMDMVQKTFDTLLLPRSYSLSSTTIGQMVSMNRRLIITLDNNGAILNNFNIWFNQNSETIQNDYANSPDLATMETHNSQYVSSFSNLQNRQSLYKMSWTLTATTTTIIEMILPWKPTNLIELADIANKDLDNWNTKISTLGYKYPVLGNIIIIDHFQTSDILSVVLQNFQFQTKNEIQLLTNQFLSKEKDTVQLQN